MKRFALPSAVLTLALTLAACGQGNPGDVTAPAVGTVNTVGQTNQVATISVTATDDTGVTRIAYTITGGGLNLTGGLDVTGKGPYQLTLPALPVGTYTVTVVAYDAKNNASQPKLYTLVVTDVDPPAVGTLKEVQGATDTAGKYAMTLEVPASDNVGVTKLAYVLDGGAAVEVTLNGSSPHVLDLGLLGVGAHSVTVTAYDALGNASSAVTHAFSVVDVDDPSVTLQTSSTSVGGAGSQTLTLTAAATDNVGVTKVEFYDGATLIGTDSTPNNGFVLPHTLTAPDASTHTFTAVAFDAANRSATSNSAEVTVNLVADASNPVLSNITHEFNGASNTIKVSGTVTDDVAVKSVVLTYTDRDGAARTVNATITGTTFTSGTMNKVAEGTVITVTASDTSGNKDVKTVTAK